MFDSQIINITQREATLINSIAKFLHADQIEMLKRPSDSKNITWSNETIQQCLAVRSVVGAKGYEYMRHLHFPFPSYRTLCRKIQNLPFAPGIQCDVLELLKQKMSAREEHEKLCALVVDEMQLKQRIEYDKSTKQMVGYVSPETLPGGVDNSEERQLAVHALVFMLRGLTVAWKQTVAYLYSGTSLDSGAYWTFTKQVLQASEVSGLKVECITSDMGPANTGLWRHVGIHSTRESIMPMIPHPARPGHSLYFVADPPHLLKNLWNCVLGHRIGLPDDIVTRHHLPSNIVSHVYVQQLMDLQQGAELRVAHKLQACHTSPSHYEKMRVCLAAQFFSRSTAAAVETSVKLGLLPNEALTTAWFIRAVNDWFDAMNARKKDHALLHNTSTAASASLKTMLEIIRHVSFSGRKIWKPIQTGIQLSTTGVLQLGEELMSKNSLQYFLTGRLSQDPVENLFSQTRGQGVVHPSCTSFRLALRLVTIAQYLEVSKGAAYGEDGCTYVIDYLKDHCRSLRLSDDSSAAEVDESELCQAASDVAELRVTESPCKVVQSELCQPFVTYLNFEPLVTEAAYDHEETVTTCEAGLHSSVCHQQLGNLEQCALYDVIGWAVHQFLATVNCDVCRQSLVAHEVPDTESCRSYYTSARDRGGLTNPSEDIMYAAYMAESVFQTNKSLLGSLPNVEQTIMQEVIDVLDTLQLNIPACHKAVYRIVKRYIRLRINVHGSMVTKVQIAMKQYGSKTACRSTVIP